MDIRRNSRLAGGLAATVLAGCLAIVTPAATASALGPGSGPALSPGPSVPGPRTAQDHGYWLVGSDGGIFSFGSAQFYGSTGSLHLQRPVVGITPTPDHGGYWLVASDGGVFAFGDAGFIGSIPGLDIAPAGTPGPGPKLNAPIVGMVPSNSGNGYFLVASDGGVFAFGDAQFEGSCPGIGGCGAPGVAVLPDGTGNGYWLVTAKASGYAFGDATPGVCEGFLPGPSMFGRPYVTSAARTPDARGCWILNSLGFVTNSGDAERYENQGPTLLWPLGTSDDPYNAIFPDASAGYWLARASGAVYPFGDAPFLGDMRNSQLNGSIIAATGW